MCEQAAAAASLHTQKATTLLLEPAGSLQQRAPPVLRSSRHLLPLRRQQPYPSQAPCSLCVPGRTLGSWTHSRPRQQGAPLSGKGSTCLLCCTCVPAAWPHELLLQLEGSVCQRAFAPACQRASACDLHTWHTLT